MLDVIEKKDPESFCVFLAAEFVNVVLFELENAVHKTHFIFLRMRKQVNFFRELQTQTQITCMHIFRAHLISL